MKYLLENNLYEETKNIAHGKVKKSPILEELSNWFMSAYSAKILNFQFTKSEIPSVKGYRLYVIMNATEDYQKMFHSPFKFKEEYMAQISKEFKRLALKYNFASEAQLADIFIRYNDFSVEARTDTNNIAVKEAKANIMGKYPMIWDISADASYGAVVFYYLDKDVAENQNKDVNKTIQEEYYLLLKKYDELDFFTRDNMRLKFDSKENVDKNFQGNVINYFR